MDQQIIFDPLLPLEILAGLAVVAILAVALAALRALPGWWLRALASLVLGVALANPSLRQEEREMLSNVAVVVIDETSSQSIGERPSQIADAEAALDAGLAAIDGLEVRKLRITDQPGNADSGTMLIAGLNEVAADVPRNRLAGAVILSDGLAHDIAPTAEFPAPVHLLLTGENDDWDRRLIIRNAPAFAIMGERVEIILAIEDEGAVPSSVDAEVDLSISVDGEIPQVFRVAVGRDLRLPLSLPHGGRNVLHFKLDTAESELTDRNNSAVVTINGIRDRLRVLLVSGEPHAGERTWRNLLKSDSAVDLVHFTILRPPNKQDGVPVSELSLIAFPTRELFLDKVDEFDLIIFDRYRRRGILPLAYLDNVVRYVKEGGAVLVASGPAFASAESLYRTALADILPAIPTAHIYETGFLPRVSDIGERHPVTENLTRFAPRPTAEDGSPGWGRWFRMIETEQISGQAVLTGPDDGPLLLLDRVGDGRVALLASDHAWLWHRGFEGGGPQLELLKRLAHWMMKEPELEEEALVAEAAGGQITITRRTLSETVGSVTVTGPDGSAQTLELDAISPGRFAGLIDGEVNGVYQLDDGALTTVAVVGPSAPREFEQTIATADRLAPLISSTRGGVFGLAAAGVPDVRIVREGRVAAGRGWLGLSARGAFATLDIKLIPLTPAIVFLLLASLFVIGAWWRESL